MAQALDMDQIHHQIRAAFGEREGELVDLHRRLVAIPTVNRGDGTSAEESRVAASAAEYICLGISYEV